MVSQQVLMSKHEATQVVASLVATSAAAPLGYCCAEVAYVLFQVFAGEKNLCCARFRTSKAMQPNAAPLKVRCLPDGRAFPARSHRAPPADAGACAGLLRAL